MIGDKLRKAREKKGLTIKDVENGTSIRSLYIEAIERGDWETLPGDVYAKGFVRNLANFLKLDGDACVAEYVSDTGGVVRSEEPVVEEDPVEKPVKPYQKKSGSGVLMVAMALIIVLGGVYLILSADDDKEIADNRLKTQNVRKAETVVADNVEKNKDVADKVKEPAKDVPKDKSKDATESKSVKANDTAQLPAPKETPTANKNTNNGGAKTSANKDVEITATLNDRCWLKVVSDGQTIFEGTAEKGKTMSWKGADRIAITAGNAGALEITHNGKKMGQVGDYGEVVNRVYTKESVN